MTIRKRINGARLVSVYEHRNDGLYVVRYELQPGFLLFEVLASYNGCATTQYYIAAKDEHDAMGTIKSKFPEMTVYSVTQCDDALAGSVLSKPGRSRIIG